MLTFEFKQDTEFSNPYYEIKYNGVCVGTIRHDHYIWRVYTLSQCRLLSPVHFIQIANKLKEIDASLRSQRWFK